MTDKVDFEKKNCSSCGEKSSAVALNWNFFFDYLKNIGLFIISSVAVFYGYFFGVLEEKKKICTNAYSTANENRNSWPKGLKSLIEVTEIQFDEKNEDHVNLIKELWKTLSECFDIENSEQLEFSLVSSIWKKLGFQGNSATSDFRGLGILAPIVILFITTTNPSSIISLQNRFKSVLSEEAIPDLSVSIINVSFTLINYLKEHPKIAAKFYCDSCHEARNFFVPQVQNGGEDKKTPATLVRKVTKKNACDGDSTSNETNCVEGGVCKICGRVYTENVEELFEEYSSLLLAFKVGHYNGEIVPILVSLVLLLKSFSNYYIEEKPKSIMEYNKILGSFFSDTETIDKILIESME